MMFDVAAIRAREFPWMNTGDTVYMNAASTGPSPQRSIAAQIDFVQRRAEPHLLDFDAQFGTLDRCRRLIAEQVGATEAEIALAPNTGAGINLAAWGWPLGPGDTVVVPDAEFPANMYPWLGAAEQRGFNVHVVPLRNGLLDEDAFLDALTKPAVKAASISWTSFSTGYVADIAKIGAECRARDIVFVVDGIQGLGPQTIDLRSVPVDIFACGGQKWLLSPWGTGFTYVRSAVLEKLAPQPVSWMAVRDADDFTRLTNYDFTYRKGARRFEQVTLAYQDFAGMAASLELAREIGFANIAKHAQCATETLLSHTAEQGAIAVTPHGKRGGIASVRPRNAQSTSARLTQLGIVHSLREGTIRLAPHLYTTERDLERTLDALGSTPLTNQRIA